MNSATLWAQSAAPRPKQVLIVDDSKAQRRMLSVQVARWGYVVTEAASGEQALQLCRETAFDMVLSDWMMPGMTGLDLCKAFRALPREDYGYFILLTSKSEKSEIASGLENGADDFLIKPVSADELHARMRAGERILRMQGEVVEKNRLISSTLDELQKLYDSLDRDLIEARKLQLSLVMDRQRDFGLGSASVLLKPSGHVGGDLVGSFLISPHCVAIYSVDVAGHGVASAMMTARLAGLLSGGSPDQNIAMTVAADGTRGSWPPDKVAERLNRMMIEDMKVDQYFTMVYAEIDMLNGHVQFVQAGHPHPVILRATGEICVVGSGGMPIGLIAGAVYEMTFDRLLPGDRLLLGSDGITECPNPAGEEVGEAGLVAMLSRCKTLSSADLLEALIWELNSHSDGLDFPDDVSAIMFDYSGPK